MNAESTISHLSDDTLVLHYYGEMPPGEEAQAAAHLQSCPRCQEGLRKLQRVLAVIDEKALAPELPEHFERTVWARLEPNLQRARGGWRSWRRTRLSRRSNTMRASAVAGCIASPPRWRTSR